MEKGSDRGSSREFMRRINIVYFLSRGGGEEDGNNSDQPHLIQVHHLHTNGIRLRDVKRWLSESRGKTMPDSFSWSYKSRRYRSGCVWQDLNEDDLLTPIAENEYVMKGSMILPHRLEVQSCRVVSKEKRSSVEEPKTVQILEVSLETVQVEENMESLPPPPPRSTSEESLELSTGIFKVDFDRKTESNRGQNHHLDQQQQQSGCSHMFRNMLRCGSSETNETALVRVTRHGSTGPHQQRSNINNGDGKFRKSKGSDGGKRAGGERSKAKYKPVGAPNCSQCGKEFKPEKLHLHMKSCKALKAQGKGRSRSLDKQQHKTELNRAREPNNKEFSTCSISGLLT